MRTMADEIRALVEHVEAALEMDLTREQKIQVATAAMNALVIEEAISGLFDNALESVIGRMARRTK